MDELKKTKTSLIFNIFCAVVNACLSIYYTIQEQGFIAGVWGVCALFWLVATALTYKKIKKQKEQATFRERLRRIELTNPMDTRVCLCDNAPTLGELSQWAEDGKYPDERGPCCDQVKQMFIESQNG